MATTRAPVHCANSLLSLLCPRKQESEQHSGRGIKRSQSHSGAAANFTSGCSTFRRRFFMIFLAYRSVGQTGNHSN